MNFYAQDDDFCLSFIDVFKIENQADIPTITDNGDGTITLTHPDQVITDLFAAYTIYSLEQSFPNSSNQETLKFYNLGHSSRGLVIDIQTNISDDIYSINTIDYTPEFPFADNFISFIDGKQLNYSGYGQTGGGCNNELTCPLGSFPEDFDLTVHFSFDTASQTLFMETVTPSSCGSEFRVAFKPGYNEGDGGNSSGQIQEWVIDNVVTLPINNDDACYNIERELYNFMGIGCDVGQYFGNIGIFYTSGVDKIRFFRDNVLSFSAIVEFRDPLLGVAENSLNDIAIFQRKGAAHLQIVNNLNQNLSAVVYSTDGKVVLEVNSIEDNRFNITTLAENQLYLIELKTEDKQRKLIKFIKR